MAITSPLLEVSIRGAKSLLINVTGGLDMSLFEVNEIVEIISGAVGDETNIVFGAIIDEKMKEEIRVSVIATQCEASKEEEEQTLTVKKTQTKKEKIEPIKEIIPEEDEIDDTDLEIPAFLRKKKKYNK